jgi:hypothetical protein
MGAESPEASSEAALMELQQKSRDLMQTINDLAAGLKDNKLMEGASRPLITSALKEESKLLEEAMSGMFQKVFIEPRRAQLEDAKSQMEQMTASAPESSKEWLAYNLQYMENLLSGKITSTDELRAALEEHQRKYKELNK